MVGGEMFGLTPLSMKIVRHIDEVVEHLCHVLHRERLEIPVRSWDGNRERATILSKLVSHEAQEATVVDSINGIATGNALVVSTRIFPIKIDTVESWIRIQKAKHIASDPLAIRRTNSVAIQLIGGGIRRLGPTAERNNLLERRIHVDKLVELIFDVVGDLDVEIRRETGKSKIDVCQRVGLVDVHDLTCVHSQASSSFVVRLKISNASELSGWTLVVSDLHPAVGNAPVGVLLEGPRRSSIGRRLRAELGRSSALPPS